MKVIDVEVTRKGLEASFDAVAIPSDLVLVEVSIGEGGILESEDGVCVGSWRWDIQSATTDEKSVHVATLLKKAQKKGFRYLACDCVSVDQHDRENLMNNLIKFSNLYETHPVVICYDGMADLKRAWISSEIKVFGNRMTDGEAYESSTAGINCIQVRELFEDGEIPSGPNGYQQTDQILREAGIFASVPVSWMGLLAQICQKLIAFLSIPANIVLLIEAALVGGAFYTFLGWRCCSHSKVTAFILREFLDDGTRVCTLSNMVQSCINCVTYLLGLNYFAQKGLLDSNRIEIPMYHWLPSLMRNLVSSERGISLFHGDVLHIVANGMLSTEEKKIYKELRRYEEFYRIFDEKVNEFESLDTPDDEIDQFYSIEQQEALFASLEMDEDDDIPLQLKFLKEFRTRCGGGQMIGYGRNECPKCKCRLFVMLNLVNRYIGERILEGDVWRYQPATKFDRHNPSVVLDWLDSLGCERATESENGVVPRVVFLENVGLGGFKLITSAQGLDLIGRDIHVDDLVEEDDQMIETLDLIMTLITNCECNTVL